MVKKQSIPGAFGVCIDNGKDLNNLGTIWRTAANFGAHFTSQIGGRYHKTNQDTLNSYRILPHTVWEDAGDFYAHLPYGFQIVAIELTDGAENLYDFDHPDNAIYVVGAEDGNIRNDVLELAHRKVVIPDTLSCMNQAVAAGVVLGDRLGKQHRKVKT